MATANDILLLQAHLQKLIRKWARNYKRKSYTNRFLDEIEDTLLFYASFTNLFSNSLKEEIHLISNAVFKSEQATPSWGPFYGRIFIKVLDWSVNGLNFDVSSLKNEREIFYRLIALTYMQNGRARVYGQKMLYCLLTKSNWKSQELLSGVLKSCKDNIATSIFSLDYVISMLSFLDVPKRTRGAFLVHCIKPSFKDIFEFEKYYKDLKLISYQCKNPFYPFYKTLLSQGRNTYFEISNITQRTKSGAQLRFSDPTSGFELIFLKDTSRIEEHLSFIKYFVPEENISKVYKSKEPKELKVGEAFSYIEPPTSAKEFKG